MDKKNDNTTPAAAEGAPLGYVDRDQLAWLDQRRNTEASIQLWAAPTPVNAVPVYTDVPPTAAATPTHDTAIVQWALKELLGALPERRDWFNPDAEKVLRAVVAETPAPVLVDDADEISPRDLRIETWRKNRGGWDTRPDNCCRITHVPTGITVTCEDDDARSIHAARAEAMRKLREAFAARTQFGITTAAQVKDADQYIHLFTAYLADYVEACIDRALSKGKGADADLLRPRKLYQKLYAHIRSAVVRKADTGT